MMDLKSRNAFVFVIAIVPVMAAAQQFLPAPPGPPVDPNTRFEVASVKPDGGASGPTINMTPGRFGMTGMPIGVLVRLALQKPAYQIVGAPGWMDTERYSISAKAPDGTPPAARTVMMVNLLKDRFQLAMHLETREQPIFHLVTARTDGRLGPDLKATPGECQATIAEEIAAAKAAAGRGGPPLLPQFDPNGPLPCGGWHLAPGIAAGRGRAIAEFVPTLADLVGRPVIDRTDLTGLYDYTLKFAPEGRRAGPFGGLLPPPPGAEAPAIDPDAPSLSAALQEQLGLKLESARGPVEVVVIDKFEKPTPD